MKIIFKIVLSLLIAVNLSFATDDYDYDWERKAVPKKFLNKDCKKLAKKIWNEDMYIYYSTTILDIWKDYVLKLFVAPEPELKDIERTKNIRYTAYNADKLTYDFDFKWINKNTLLVQHYSSEKRNHYEDSCELWLFEEKDDKVNSYHFISWNLPD